MSKMGYSSSLKVGEISFINLVSFHRFNQLIFKYIWKLTLCFIDSAILKSFEPI